MIWKHEGVVMRASVCSSDAASAWPTCVYSSAACALKLGTVQLGSICRSLPTASVELSQLDALPQTESGCCLNGSITAPNSAADADDGPTDSRRAH